MTAVVSIHDCMPETMGRVVGLLNWLRERAVPPVTLLVVPGRDWSQSEIDHLRDLAAEGHPLAAHGWVHHTRPVRLYHRCHAAFISRNVAEHLSLDPPDIVSLMRRSRDWFIANALPAPDLYVPPAWALGPLAGGDLSALPYQAIETTCGLWLPHATGGPVFRSLPLAGYEADTPLREVFLRCWNRVQASIAQRRSMPLRISIHPNDLDLRLADQLTKQLGQVRVFRGYADLSAEGAW